MTYKEYTSHFMLLNCVQLTQLMYADVSLCQLYSSLETKCYRKLLVIKEHFWDSKESSIHIHFNIFTLKDQDVYLLDWRYPADLVMIEHNTHYGVV